MQQQEDEGHTRSGLDAFVSTKPLLKSWVQIGRGLLKTSWRYLEYPQFADPDPDSEKIVRSW